MKKCTNNRTMSFRRLLSLLLGLGGLYSAARFEPLDAMLCLMLAGLLDAFDGTEVMLTVNGAPLESGHNIYDYALTRYEE